MANHKSAKKCVKQIAKRTLINKHRKSRIKTFIKKFECLLSDHTSILDIKNALVDAESEIMRGVTKGVLHKNTAARKVSRLTKKFKVIESASA